MLEVFLKGFGVSLIATFPIGVMSAISIARVLRGGYKAGFFTLLGSSFADLVSFFIILSGLSSSFVRNPDVRFFMSIVASIVIILIGISVIKNRVEKQYGDKDDIETSANNFLSGFFITIFNPYQFIAYSIFLASFGIHFSSKNLVRTFSAGAFLGSFVWTIVIPYLIVKLKERYTEKVKKIYPFIGYIVVIAGIVLLVRGIVLFLN